VHYPPEADTQAAITVSERTGEIRTRQLLDYERRTSYSLLAVDRTGEQGGVRITVEVLDENDNAPVFPQKQVCAPAACAQLFR
jgi:hypothetical protein